jgi:hyperosmotically inducible protein
MCAQILDTPPCCVRWRTDDVQGSPIVFSLALLADVRFTQTKKHDQHQSQIGKRRRRTAHGRRTGLHSTAKHECTGEYVDDAVITAKFKTAIFQESTRKSAEINLEMFKGVVQPSGFVSSSDAESTAVAVAHNIEGVRSFKNDMRIK